MSQAESQRWQADVRTLSIDIGGSGLKASLLDSAGVMLTERVRVETPYPCPPERLVTTLLALVEPLGGAHRVSVGFPGLVRHGHVIAVPSLSRGSYDGDRDPALAAAWHGFDLAGALGAALALPTLVVNDADMQGCAVAEGTGVEFVMTLGTGVGTALFADGALLPHMELSHGPFKSGMTIDEALGNVQRKLIGKERWIKRVRLAITIFDEMLWFDRIYVGGGNAKHLAATDVGERGQVVPNSAGILGGVRIWALHGENT